MVYKCDNGFAPKWMVYNMHNYIMENPKIKWMRTGGSLILGNPHMFILSYQESTPTQPENNDCPHSK